MKKVILPTMVLITTAFCSRPARADRVGELVRELKSNPSYKVRLTAVLTLAKYADPRAVKALIYALKKSDEDPRVRGFAAMALGRLRARKAIRALRRATRSKNAFLKARAKKALHGMCPPSLRGKRFYINVDKLKASGPKSRMAGAIASIQIAKILAKRKDVTMGWPRCKKPSRRDIRRKRLKAFYLDTRVKVSNSGGKTAVKVSVLFTTYPGQSIKGNAGAKAAVPGAPSRSNLSNLIGALVGAIKSDISRFLDSQ